MKSRISNNPPVWVAWVAAVIGILFGFMVWVPEGPDINVLFYLALVVIVICTGVVSWVGITRRSFGLGVLATLTLLSPMIVLLGSFATW